jgi:hypothetical protein
MNLTSLIKDNTVKFDFYRAGIMYYTIERDGKKHRFPVPISDIGDATFLSEDKAILFMRYIRKAIESNELQTL